MINPTPEDVGRRVQQTLSVETNLGVITRVWEDVVYVRWDYQGPQDAPYPTTPGLLDWEEATETPDPVAAAISEAVSGFLLDGGLDDTSDPETPSSDDLEGEGGDFGGGGAEGEW